MASEVGVAYVNIIPKSEGFTSSVAEASKEAGQHGANSIKDSLLGTLKGTFGDMFSTGGEMGSKLAGGMESFLSGAGKLAVIGAVAAIGAEALHELEQIGEQIDEMTDTIIVGTGAAGEQLESLKQSAMGVATDVPAGFAKSGDIIQDFNTRLGLSGEQLDTVATAAAQLDYIVGGINYDNMATMFNVWGVGADDMTAKMDYMFGVAQNTGIGFDQLTSIMKSSGPTLQNLGFSFEESANMAGLLDKSGIDASSTMSRLSKALVELSEPGESAQDAFRRTVDEMQAYIDAGDTAAAMDLATELFGTRGAAQFIGALQSGALSMDALSDASLGATGSVQGTYDAVKSWPETWQLIQTRVEAALEPLGSSVFTAISGILDTASEAMTGLWQASEPLREAIGELAGEIGEHFAPIAEALDPLLTSIANGGLAVISGAFQTAANVVEAASVVIIGAIDAMRPIVDVVTGIFDGVKSAIEDPIGTAQQFIEDAISTIEGIIDGMNLELPHIALPHFYVWGGSFPWGIGGQGSMPQFSVDWYAKGGIVEGAQLIGAGERGAELVWPSYDPYLDKYASAIAEHMPAGAGGVDIHDCTFNVRRDSDIRAIAVELNTLINRQTAGGIA